MNDETAPEDPRLRVLCEGLLAERPGSADTPEGLARAFGSMRLALRALMNIRAPGPIDPAWLALQDEVLSEENRARALELPDEPLLVWRGDITRLRVDGIVNAANSAMLGCFGALHYCIDNAIHSAAGLQLRQECARVIGGGRLGTGDARVTSGWNLPARFVVHTVGPTVSGTPTIGDEEALRRSYRSVLAAAIAKGMESLALCCVSTGVFDFPADRAAEIAVEEVRAARAEGRAPERIVFCVYHESDERKYRELLR